MLADYKARILLGLPPNSCPTPSQVKAAYKRKVLETHPDLFPDHEKSDAESKFKSIAEAYTLLLSGTSCRKEPFIYFYSRLFTSGEERSSVITRRKRKSNSYRSPVLFDHYDNSCTWWIKCLKGLQKAKGNISFFS